MSVLDSAEVIRTNLRMELKKKIMSPPDLEGHSEQKTQLTNLITQVTQFGESDSALICGPPGSGKTKLVNTIIKELSKKHPFFLVKLNGFIHTDDGLALKEIVQTLNADEAVVEEISNSFAGNLTAILETLMSDGSMVDKPIVFILEEFQLFCSHRKQTLLYTLMDASQSVNVPVCVVGVTSCFEVTQQLEKRVKSRFSHNQIFLYPPNDFSSRLELFKHLISVDGINLDPDKRCNKPEIQSFRKLWQENCQELVEHPKVLEVLKRQYSVDKNEQSFRNLMLMVVSQLNADTNEYLTVGNIINVFNSSFRDQTVFALEGLSVLELCLVVAMNHHINLFDDEPFNFEMIYRRFIEFTEQSSVIVKSSRAPLMKAFQKLTNLELITPVSAHSKDVLKDFNLYRFNVTHEQIQEVIKRYPELSPTIKDWATSAIN